MTTQSELRRIVQRLPADMPPFRPVVLQPAEHTLSTATYAVTVPLAGTMLGIRLPRGYPACKLLAVWWVGGDNVVMAGGHVPPRAARLLKFWCAGEQQLRVSLGFDTPTNMAALMLDRGLRPYSLLVPPAVGADDPGRES